MEFSSLDSVPFVGYCDDGPREPHAMHMDNIYNNHRRSEHNNNHASTPNHPSLIESEYGVPDLHSSIICPPPSSHGQLQASSHTPLNNERNPYHMWVENSLAEFDTPSTYFGDAQAYMPPNFEDELFLASTTRRDSLPHVHAYAHYPQNSTNKQQQVISPSERQATSPHHFQFNPNFDAPSSVSTDLDYNYASPSDSHTHPFKAHSDGLKHDGFLFDSSPNNYIKHDGSQFDSPHYDDPSRLPSHYDVDPMLVRGSSDSHSPSHHQQAQQQHLHMQQHQLHHNQQHIPSPHADIHSHELQQHSHFQQYNYHLHPQQQQQQQNNGNNNSSNNNNSSKSNNESSSKDSTSVKKKKRDKKSKSKLKVSTDVAEPSSPTSSIDEPKSGKSKKVSNIRKARSKSNATVISKPKRNSLSKNEQQTDSHSESTVNEVGDALNVSSESIPSVPLATATHHDTVVDSNSSAPLNFNHPFMHNSNQQAPHMYASSHPHHANSLQAPSMRPSSAQNNSHLNLNSSSQPNSLPSSSSSNASATQPSQLQASLLQTLSRLNALSRNPNFQNALNPRLANAILSNAAKQSKANANLNPNATQISNLLNINNLIAQQTGKLNPNSNTFNASFPNLSPNQFSNFNPAALNWPINNQQSTPNNNNTATSSGSQQTDDILQQLMNPQLMSFNNQSSPQLNPDTLNNLSFSSLTNTLKMANANAIANANANSNQAVNTNQGMSDSFQHQKPVLAQPVQAPFGESAAMAIPVPDTSSKKRTPARKPRRKKDAHSDSTTSDNAIIHSTNSSTSTPSINARTIVSNEIGNEDNDSQASSSIHSSSSHYNVQSPTSAASVVATVIDDNTSVTSNPRPPKRKSVTDSSSGVNKSWKSSSPSASPRGQPNQHQAVLNDAQFQIAPMPSTNPKGLDLSSLPNAQAQHTQQLLNSLGNMPNNNTINNPFLINNPLFNTQNNNFRSNSSQPVSSNTQLPSFPVNNNPMQQQQQQQQQGNTNSNFVNNNQIPNFQSLLNSSTSPSSSSAPLFTASPSSSLPPTFSAYGNMSNMNVSGVPRNPPKLSSASSVISNASTGTTNTINQLMNQTNLNNDSSSNASSKSILNNYQAQIQHLSQLQSLVAQIHSLQQRSSGQRSGSSSNKPSPPTSSSSSVASGVSGNNSAALIKSLNMTQLQSLQNQLAALHSSNQSTVQSSPSNSSSSSSSQFSDPSRSFAFGGNINARPPPSLPRNHSNSNNSNASAQAANNFQNFSNFTANSPGDMLDPSNFQPPNAGSQNILFDVLRKLNNSKASTQQDSFNNSLSMDGNNQHSGNDNPSFAPSNPSQSLFSLLSTPSNPSSGNPNPHQFQPQFLGANNNSNSSINQNIDNTSSRAANSLPPSTKSDSSYPLKFDLNSPCRCPFPNCGLVFPTIHDLNSHFTSHKPPRHALFNPAVTKSLPPTSFNAHLNAQADKIRSSSISPHTLAQNDETSHQQ